MKDLIPFEMKKSDLKNHNRYLRETVSFMILIMDNSVVPAPCSFGRL